MASQEVGALLEECLKEAEEPEHSQQLSEAERLQHCSCTDALCAELASLLQDAVEMKWPFVPEKWQYKHSVSASDKTNLSDLISKHLPQLLAVLKSSILAQEARSALAVVFLVDRFLYWIDESSILLKIAKLLHKHHPDAPIAPQLVIRQARVYVNSGKLQKAEYILSSLINNSGKTGCWEYQSERERVLVQAVSVQVRGTILQKLGLWREAAELIWASLVGFYSLPQPDKKGIGTSLGILANILVSMNDEDFHALVSNPDIDFSLLGDGSHRLLSAAQAAKMAVVYSQYTSLYVLTNVVTQGTCLLSYSFSIDCPASQKQSFLLQAREAFTIGLLTKAECDLVTSQQELHTFLKAAYSLTVTGKWLGARLEDVAPAAQACQNAIEKFYKYCVATEEKTGLSTEIMQHVAQVKVLLRVKPFENSDKASFIPDSYRDMKDVSVTFTLEDFSKIMQRFQKYHASVSESSSKKCKSALEEEDGPKLCFTALETTVDRLPTKCSTEACNVKRPRAGGLPESGSSSGHSAQNLGSTVGSQEDLGSSWENFSPSSSFSLQHSSGGFIGSGAVRQGRNDSNQSFPTTEQDGGGDSDAVLQPAGEIKTPNPPGRDSGLSSQAVPNSSQPSTSSSNASNDSGKFEVIEAEIETEAEDGWMNDVGAGQRQPGDQGEVWSLSQLTLGTSSTSLSDSFGSQSSWEKISSDFSSSGKHRPSGRPKAGTNQRSQSQDSDGSFSLLNTTSSENGSAHDHLDKKQYQSRPTKSPNVDPNMAPPRPPSSVTSPQQYADTETSTDSSFEFLGETHSEQKHNIVTEKKKKKNPLCFSCLNRSTFTAVNPLRQFVLSEQDYRALLAGVCHDCLLERLHSDETLFKLETGDTASSALHLKFSKTTGLWTARETCVYIGKYIDEGKQRRAVSVQFLHQEERLSSYVGKDYLKPRGIQFHLKDVERQMTAQYYVTEFNKSLYDKEVMAQIFFIPSEALLILDGDKIVGCISVEPYMLGQFVKLTNNTWKTDPSLQATAYGLAFGHFTCLFSEGQEVVVDLQGWVTGNGKGLTYLTDPQIHSTKIPQGRSNHSERGIREFVERQHGPECNEICQLLQLPPMGTWPNVFPLKS